MKRVVRTRILKISSQQQQVLLLVGSVLLVVGGGKLLRYQTPTQSPMNVKPLSINVGQMIYSPSKDIWENRKGWWGGYWWGSDSFFWHGREWGLGKSSYPWFWEYDGLALDLDLAALAKKGKWFILESNILNKMTALKEEIKATDNKATIRKLERTMDRLEYYLYNAKLYQRSPLHRRPGR